MPIILHRVDLIAFLEAKLADKLRGSRTASELPHFATCSRATASAGLTRPHQRRHHDRDTNAAEALMREHIALTLIAMEACFQATELRTATATLETGDTL